MSSSCGVRLHPFSWRLQASQPSRILPDQVGCLASSLHSMAPAKSGLSEHPSGGLRKTGGCKTGHEYRVTALR